MPRKSVASLTVVPINAAKVRVKPRSGAPDAVQRLIVELAATVEPEHFKPSDKPLLES